MKVRVSKGGIASWISALKTWIQGKPRTSAADTQARDPHLPASRSKHHRTFIEIAEHLAAYPATREQSDLWLHLAEDADQPLLIAVMGHFKTGKSTFLNALFQDRILATDVLPATAAVTVLRYGAHRHVLAHSPGKKPIALPYEKLKDISAENGAEWAQLRESISHLEVTLPHHLLKRVTLVDTPGLNSVNPLHTRVTREFVHRADAVLWVFGCPQAGTKTERDEIKKLPSACRPYAVVNQIDLLDPDEQDTERFLAELEARLNGLVHKPIGISAKLALERMPESNWASFMDLLDSQILAASAERKTERVMERIGAGIQKLTAAVSPHAEQLRHALAATVDWDSYELSLQARIQALAADARQWRVGSGRDGTDLVLAAPDLSEIENGNHLSSRRELLRGMIDAMNVESEQMNVERERLDERGSKLRTQKQQHEQRVTQYNQSGLFGGPPILGGFFDGGEGDRLKRNDASLRREEAEYNSAVAAHRVAVDAFRSRLDRLNLECDEFADVVHDAFVRTVAKLENDRDHRDQALTKAEEAVRDLGWVSELLHKLFAGPLREASISLLPNEEQRSTPTIEQVRANLAALERLKASLGQQNKMRSDQQLRAVRNRPRLSSALAAEHASGRRADGQQIAVPSLATPATTDSQWMGAFAAFICCVLVVLYLLPDGSSSTVSHATSQPNYQAAVTPSGTMAGAQSAVRADETQPTTQDVGEAEAAGVGEQSNVSERRERARQAAQGEDWDGAIREYEYLVKEAPDDHVLRAEMEKAINDRNASVGAAMQVEVANLLARANMQFESGAYDSAAGLVRSALEKSPGNETALAAMERIRRAQAAEEALSPTHPATQ